MTSTRSIELSVNGKIVSSQVEARRSLADFLRLDLGLTGTHLGCEHGVCGACTVQVDGIAVRGCLMLAVQAHGRSVRTVEGLATGNELHPLQQAFRECHGLQCGFCTAGVLMTMEEFLREQPSPSEAEIREALTGNICRCTGYQGIVDALLVATGQLQMVREGA
jgi:aerobic carbon-monoxide dehydrogenase small subunit